MNKFIKIILMLIGFAFISASLAIFIPKFPSGVGGGKVARINIEGVITSSGSGGLFSGKQTNSERVLDKLEEAEETSDVKAVLLRINSPGGGAVASREIAESLKEINKPVIARIVSQGTSGAYWIASAADKIVADPLSIVGSIGVTSSYLEYSGLLNKYGIEYVRLVSGKYKDLGSQYRNLTEEERRILMKKVMKVDKIFKESIRGNRNLTEEQFKKINSSKFYLGMKSKELGLVDKLGGREETEELLKEELNLSKIKYKEFKEEFSLLDFLFSNVGLQGLKAVSHVPKFFRRFGQSSYP